MSYTEETRRQIIHEHSRKPRNWGELENYSHSCVGHNPNCSDSIKVTLRVSPGGVIDKIRFRASGSAMSKASASLMSLAVRGKTTGDALRLFSLFHNLATGKKTQESDREALGKLTIFEGIYEHPSRVKCATLAWHALKGALEKIPETILERDATEPFETPADEELDLAGVKCPINFVRVKVKMSKMDPGKTLCVILDEGEPIRNVPRSLEMEGRRILFQKKLDEGRHAIVVRV